MTALPAALAFQSTAPAFSDADEAAEVRAQQIFYAALAEFTARVRDVQCLTSLYKTDMDDVLAAVDDHAPGVLQWDEAIADCAANGRARRPS